MKTITLLAIFMAFSILSNVSASSDCDHMGRATTTDQKNMALDVALKFLGLEEKNILKMEVSNYASWKSIQVMCLADIVHFANVEIENRDGEGRRCVTTMDLHTKDFFVAQLEYNREYKARNVQTNCFDENQSQRESVNQCDSMSQCPRKRDGTLYRDIYDSCSCKYITEMIQFDDVQGLYEDFYNPEASFSKPEGLQSPFN
jgi:hypothetical protein